LAQFRHYKEDPQRAEIHQQISRRIQEATASTVILVEDETDIRLFPVLRRMRIDQQIKLIAPMQNQCRTLFGAIEINSGEVFYRTYPRKRTVEMISYLEDLLVHYTGRPVLLILDHASIHKSRC
jgi:DDE superfamily endonuclease